MQKNAAHTYAISSLLVLSLTGCAWIPSTPLVQGATSAQPVPGPTPVANGSIFQSAQPINYGYQPLFEDRRPRNIGDTLTIVLQENVSASKSSSANASRDGKTNFGFDTVPRYLQGLFGNARADVEASGGNTFNGKGGANASNTFSGTLTVTVDQVLVNGNLHVVGEKQIAINQGTEFIRFSGVVNPRTISGSNTVPSTQVADARIEYVIKFLSALILLLVITAAQAERIRDLTSVQGVRQNSLIGYGLVVGLDGTGDQTTQTPFTTQTLNNMLSQLGITVPTGTNMQLKNVAAVMVTASLPPFGRQGQTIDVVVSSMGNAKSLRGGTLLMTPLKGVDSQVYALAQGNILVGGAGASAGGSSVQVNQLNGGRITNGAVIERELPSQFGVGNTLNLQLNDEDFSMAQQIADTINRVRGYGSATALDARTIQVRVPSGNSSQVRFLADIQNMQVNVTPQDAKVVINSRTGSVVMNREVTLDSCAVAQGNLSVTVNRQANVSQPDTPFGGGQTVVTPQTQIDLRQSGGSLQSVRSSASLNNVVRALNALGATPMDLMSILQSMQSAGCLRAKLEII
ncbi:flagellar basal body L-ring protein [Escherichia coli]|nr:flagellar basal body L-ring protein [Escherichia coli]